MAKNLLIEKYVPAIRLQAGYNSKLPITTTGKITGGSGQINGNLIVSGTISSGGETSSALTITATSADALAVGSQGTTNPALQVDTSGGVTDVTGLYINANAAGSGLALSTTSSGTNENLTIDAKGSGTVTINGTATGIVALPANSTVGGVAIATSSSATVPFTLTGSNAAALAVGQNGATNPAFNIDTSTATSVNGINIKSNATGTAPVLSVISSATNENLSIQAKGTGTISIATVSSGTVSIGSALVVSKVASAAFNVGANGSTNPVLVVNSNTASVATGISVIGAAAGAGVAVNAISSGTNEALQLNGKGTGNVVIQAATATPAGGSGTAALLFGTTSGFGVYYGSGAPTVTAAQGSLYIRSDGSSTSTRLYVNTTGSTTWTNFTSAA